MQDDASVIAESICWLLQIDALSVGVAADPTVCVGVVLVGLLGAAAAAKDGGGGVGGPKINWKHPERRRRDGRGRTHLMRQLN